MLKKIAGTVVSRLLIAIISFLLVILTTNYIGAEGYAIILLIVLGIALILIANNLICGAIIYFTPRTEVFRLLVPAYVWALFTSATGAYILKIFKLIPDEYMFDVMLLTILHSLTNIHYNILIGKEKIKEFNLISLIQVIVLISSFIIFIFVLNAFNVTSYIYSLYIACSITFVLSFSNIIRFIKIVSLSGWLSLLKQVLKYTIFTELANMFQTLNYRLSYYIINLFTGKIALGVFGAGTQLSEGMWFFGKGTALVQFSRIANTNDLEYAKSLTLSFVKLVMILTLLMLIVILLLPEDFFIMLFGPEFGGVKTVIYCLSFGILAMVPSMMFSHYFSGTGLPKFNMIGSAIGLIITVLFGFTLIPKYGLVGAGITASLSYTTTAIYQFVIFIRLTNTGLREFLITRNDIILISRELKMAFSR